MLTKLSGINFMGGTFTVELGPLNYVHGRNDAGKSRLDELIKLLLLGRPTNPSIDKTARGIYDAYASGVRMEIEGALSDGSSVKRWWETKGDTVKSGKQVPEKFYERTPLVLLDPLDYLGRSARGRIELAFNVAQNVKCETKDLVSALVKHVGQETAGRICGRASMVDRDSVQDCLNAMAEAAEVLRSESAAEVRRFTGTLQGLTHLQLEDKPASRSVADIDEEIDREQKACAEKTGRRQRLGDEQEASEKTELERDDLLHRIEQAGSPSPKVFDINSLRGREVALASKAKTAREKIDAFERWERDNGTNQIEKAVIERRIRYIQSGMEEIKRGVAKIAQLERPSEPKTCPTCGHISTKGVAVHPDAQKIRARLSEISDANPDELAQARRILSKIGARMVPAPFLPEEDMNALEAELRVVRADIDEYVRTADVQAWRSRLEQLPKPIDNAASIKELDAEIQKHASRVTALREERRAAESDRADRRRLAEAQTELAKATAAETVYKDAKKFLLAKKAELIEEVFGPLLKTAALFMKGIFPQPVEYRDGELGMFNGSSWVTEATFGGAKRAMLYAALKCALGSQSPLRIIEMDELSTIDPINLKKFLSNVKEAHLAGVFDQFIGMTCRLDGPVSGFTMIEATGNGYIREHGEVLKR